MTTLRIAGVALAAAALAIVAPGAANAATPTLPGATLPPACIGLGDIDGGIGYCPPGGDKILLPGLSTCIPLGVYEGRTFGIGVCA